MLREMTGKGLGFTAVVDAGERVLGIFTDGDLRRLIERGADLRALHRATVMHRRPQARARRRAGRRRGRGDGAATASPACWWSTPQGRLVGALNSNDLMRAKVI